MRRTKPAFCLAFLIFCFQLFLYPSKAAGPTMVMYSIDQPTTWTKGNSPYIVLGQVKIKAPLTIEAGTIVKFGTGSNDGLNIQSDLFVNGTSEEKVIFTSLRDDAVGGDTDDDHGYYKPHTGDWTSLNFNPSEDKILDVENAAIRYSNFGISISSSNNYYKNRTVKKCELRENGYGILVYNAEPVIENNIIAENQTGILVQASTRKAKISNNAIFQNKFGAQGINSANPALGAIDAKNNWWGDASGPQNENNPSGKGNSAIGQVSFDPWLKQDPAHIGDPVIIIPGILGSWKKDGEWQLDPILHTYDNLYAEFENAGYIPEEDLFTFPYEWRDSNKVNAVALRGKIQQIKNLTHKAKVDIVAHSMGGLLAREYIESGYYDNDVDQLITVGTPNLGAPKDYLTWEAGEFDGPWAYLFKSIFKHEAEENGYYGYSSIFDYIQGRPIVSAKELLPVYNYLYDAENDSALRESYPNNYPRNEFLESLNDQSKVKLLENVETTKIIGKQNRSTTTISGFNVINNVGAGGIWEHGYPQGYNIPLIGEGMKKSDGDGTVTLISAESISIPANRTIALPFEHNALPTDAQKDILEILTGKTPTNEIKNTSIPNILLILVHSPVDIQIQSPSGQKIGKNFANGSEFDQIPGAFYSGFDTDQEFITIPNPEDGEYKVLAEGTGTGEYTIETTKITQDESSSQGAAESTATITGTAVPKVQEENKIEISGDSVKKVEPLTLLSKKKEEEKTNAEVPKVALTDAQTQVEPAVDASPQPFGSRPKIGQLDNLKNSVRNYFKTKLIRKKGERDYLLGWMGNIRVHLKRQQMLLEKSKISQKTYDKHQKEVIGHCDHLIAHIRKNSPQNVDPLAAEILIASISELKN